MFHHEFSNQKSTNGRVRLFRLFNATLSQLAPPLAARLAERIFRTPISARPPVRESAWARGAKRTSVSSTVGQIPVWVWGDGPSTVLLVHGWSGRGLQLGALVEPLVQRGFRVTTHDAPAHGEAPGRISSMPAFAAALGAVARRFSPVSGVIAHSLGSAAAIFALAQDELPTDRIVTISPAARLHAIGERFGEMTGFAPHVIDRMREGLERRLNFSWEDAESLRIAPKMTMGMMVIHDSGDRFIPHHEGAELAKAWPDGLLMTTTGLGHHRILRNREVIDSAAAFIAEPVAHTQMERRAS